MRLFCNVSSIILFISDGSGKTHCHFKLQLFKGTMIGIVPSRRTININQLHDQFRDYRGFQDKAVLIDASVFLYGKQFDAETDLIDVGGLFIAGISRFCGRKVFPCGSCNVRSGNIVGITVIIQISYDLFPKGFQVTK